MEAACCVKVVLTAENAIAEIERAIQVALSQSAPAYIVVPQDVGLMPVVGAVSPGAHVQQIKRAVSNPKELDAAVNAIVNRLQSSASAVLLPSVLAARYGLAEKVQQLINATKLPFALAPLSKGFLDEQHPQFLGMYMGVESTPKGLQEIVETADLILDLGGQVNEHVNTGFWTARLPEQALVCIHETWVQIGEHVFVDVAMGDLLDRLIERAPAWASSSRSAPNYDLIPIAGQRGEATSCPGFYPRLQRMLKPADILVIDGGSILPVSYLRLPEGVRAENQILWSSIGWAGPAALGIAMADPDRRVILVTGDGAHQQTIGVIASMGFYDIKPIVFVLHSDTYGCENELWPGSPHYNDIAPIHYSRLPEVFGCNNWLCKRVSTIGELDDALAALELQRDQAAYIEVMIPAEESVLLPEPVRDALYKLKTPTGL